MLRKVASSVRNEDLISASLKIFLCVDCFGHTLSTPAACSMTVKILTNGSSRPLLLLRQCKTALMPALENNTTSSVNVSQIDLVPNVTAEKASRMSEQGEDEIVGLQIPLSY